MAAYYNEIEPYAAQWLRNLIAAGHIAPGDVDERDIRDVRPDDLRGYTQCHFFAGIGVWSYALRLGGWSDDRPVWTGSCPCQPFSQAGRGAGFDDERHVWPAWDHLIRERRPAAILGEQVASKDAEPWLDLVSSDLEGLGYAFGALAFPSAGVGAPHIRDRTYFVAHAGGTGLEKRKRNGQIQRGTVGARKGETIIGSGDLSRLADTNSKRSLPSALAGIHSGEEGSRSWHGESERLGAIGRMAYTERESGCSKHEHESRRRPEGPEHTSEFGGDGEEYIAGPTNGFWRDADWLLCRDEKWRPVEPGTFPLADGAASRVGRLRAYGNAVNAYQAAEFIAAARETIDA